MQIKAWEALAKIQPRNQEAVQVLVEVAQGKMGKEFHVREGVLSTSFAVVIDALETLVKIGAIEKVLPLLLKAVRNENEKGEIRFTAAHMLGELGPAAKSSIPTLTEFLRTPSRTKEDDGIKYFVIASLYKIDPTSEDVIAAFEEIVAHNPEPDLRNLATVYLAQMPTKKSQKSNR